MVRLPNPPRTLGEHLLAARYARGLRQQDVAARLGVSEWNYLNWEKGRTHPHLRFRPAIYRWLGCCPVETVPTGIGQRLVAWRTAQGLSQLGVARLLGIDPGTLSRVERGELGSPNQRVRRALETLLLLRDLGATDNSEPLGVPDHGRKR